MYNYFAYVCLCVDLVASSFSACLPIAGCFPISLDPFYALLSVCMGRTHCVDSDISAVGRSASAGGQWPAESCSLWSVESSILWSVEPNRHFRSVQSLVGFGHLPCHCLTDRTCSAYLQLTRLVESHGWLNIRCSLCSTNDWFIEV